MASEVGDHEPSGETAGSSSTLDFDETPAFFRSRSAIALVIAGLLGVFTLVATLWVRDTIAEAGTLRLRRAVERAGVFLEERAQAYAQIVQGTGALFRASDGVDRAEFRHYADALRLQENYVGLLGLGFAERVQANGLDAWLKRAQEEVPELELKGIGRDSELVINRFIEPAALNQPAVGFNCAGDAIRARALMVSRSRDDLASTGRIRLLQDPNGSAGFSLYLPVTKRGSPDPIGWVFGTVRASDLVHGIEAAAGGNVVLRVSESSEPLPLLGPEQPLRGGISVNAEFVDRAFRVEGVEGVGFYSTSERLGPWAILVFGLAATALSYALVDSLRRTEFRSRQLAMRMTRALRIRERELEQANAALERLATTDGLTGLINRRVFDERLAEEIARARRNGTALCLILLDVDHFKLFNDTYGHPAGDECLRKVAVCLRGSVRRAGEIVARYGGEEVAILLPGSDEAAAAVVAERARAAVEKLAIPHEKNAAGVVTVSLGIGSIEARKLRDSSPPTLQAATADVVTLADAALYRAKRGGRNRVELRPPDIQAAVS